MSKQSAWSIGGDQTACPNCHVEGQHHTLNLGPLDGAVITRCKAPEHDVIEFRYGGIYRRDNPLPLYDWSDDVPRNAGNDQGPA